jgi:hypothetical protein
MYLPFLHVLGIYHPFWYVLQNDMTPLKLGNHRIRPLQASTTHERTILRWKAKAFVSRHFLRKVSSESQ